MKNKVKIIMLMAAVLIFGTVGVIALEYTTPEDTDSITARFNLVNPDEADDEFEMLSEDGEFAIYITNDTPVYFQDYVPLSDECDGLTREAREVLFGRTLAEVLDGRNLRVTFDEYEQITSVVILFEVAIALPPEEVDLENGYDNGYVDITTLPGEVVFEDFDPIVLNGEIVVNNVILENARLPFWYEPGNYEVVMVPLRAVAEALGYDVTWNAYLRSVQLGVGVHIWIGNTEAHRGRMAPIQLSTAPVIVDDLTFVPLDFFRDVLNQTVYVFEGQVVVETYSDMQ